MISKLLEFFISERVRLARFLFVGFLGLLINLGITYGFTKYAHLWYFWAFLVGTIVSWTFSFLVNARVTFEQRSSPLATWFKQYCIFVSGYLGFFWVNAAVVYGATSVLGLPYVFSISISAVVTAVGTFTFSKLVVFSDMTVERLWPISLDSVLKKVRTHWVGLLLAFIIGGLCVAPQVYFANSSAYRGIAMIGPDAAEHYIARIQEVYDQHPSLGNVFLADKNKPYLVPGLGELVIASLGRAAGITASTADVTSKFVLPFLIALLVYVLTYVLARSRIAALIATSALVGEALMSTGSAWQGLFAGTSSVTGFLSLARPINPEVSGILLFSALLVFYRAFYCERSPKILESIATGLFSGAALYVSPFVSSFLFGVLALSWLLFFYHRNYKLVQQTTLAFLAACIAVVPFGLHYLRLLQNPGYADSAHRIGVILTHAPALSFWLVILMILVCFLWPRRFEASRPFFAVVLAAICLLTEQQLLTGHALQFSHYHWYITKPFIGIIGAIFCVYLAERWVPLARIRFGAYGLVIGICLFSGALVQYHSYQSNLPAALTAERYAPMLFRLEELPVEESVWANRTFSLYIPIYTRQDAPNSDYVEYYLVPEQYLVDRLLLEYKLRGVKPKDALSLMKTERADISARLFGVYYRDQLGSYAAIPNALLTEYADQYPTVYAEPLSRTLKELGVSVIVWDRNAEPEWNLDVHLYNKLYSAEGIDIYEVL